MTGNSRLPTFRMSHHVPFVKSKRFADGLKQGAKAGPGSAVASGSAAQFAGEFARAARG